MTEGNVQALLQLADRLQVDAVISVCLEYISDVLVPQDLALALSMCAVTKTLSHELHYSF